MPGVPKKIQGTAPAAQPLIWALAAVIYSTFLYILIDMNTKNDDELKIVRPQKKQIFKGKSSSKTIKKIPVNYTNICARELLLSITS